jgi:hypothetical protein
MKSDVVFINVLEQTLGLPLQKFQRFMALSQNPHPLLLMKFWDISKASPFTILLYWGIGLEVVSINCTASDLGSLFRDGEAKIGDHSSTQLYVPRHR